MAIGVYEEKERNQIVAAQLAADIEEKRRGSTTTAAAAAATAVANMVMTGGDSRPQSSHGRTLTNGLTRATSIGSNDGQVTPRMSRKAGDILLGGHKSHTSNKALDTLGASERQIEAYAATPPRVLEKLGMGVYDDDKRVLNEVKKLRDEQDKAAEEKSIADARLAALVAAGQAPIPTPIAPKAQDVLWGGRKSNSNAALDRLGVAQTEVDFVTKRGLKAYQRLGAYESAPSPRIVDNNNGNEARPSSSNGLPSINTSPPQRSRLATATQRINDTQPQQGPTSPNTGTRRSTLNRPTMAGIIAAAQAQLSAPTNGNDRRQSVVTTRSNGNGNGTSLTNNAMPSLRNGMGGSSFTRVPSASGVTKLPPAAGRTVSTPVTSSGLSLSSSSNPNNTSSNNNELGLSLTATSIGIAPRRKGVAPSAPQLLGSLSISGSSASSRAITPLPVLLTTSLYLYATRLLTRSLMHISML
jgi:hypothetical protein